MFATLATTAILAAGSASARTASARSDTITFPFRALLDHPSASGSASHDSSGSYSYTSDDQHEVNHDVQRSSIKCKGSASSSGYSAARDAHVEAVTDAIKEGCSSYIDYDWAGKIEKKFRDDAGYAVAEVWASAKASCEGEGNVYGCAAAYAAANRWARATVSAYADAWADAWNYCECNDKEQYAGSYAFGSAEEMKDLVAKVSAVAEADVCVYGTGSATAHVESHCLQLIYANVWAKSISAALIKGNCYKGIKADTYVKAEAVIDTWEYVDCASHASEYY